MTGHVEPAYPNDFVAPTGEWQRASTQELQLLDLAQDAIIVRDAEDRVVFWNAAAERAYGWSRAEALGRVSHELFRARFPAPMAEVLASFRREGRWEGEVVHVGRDGRSLVVSSRWAARRDADGRIVEVLEANRDVTAQRRAEEALRDSESRYRTLADSTPALLWQTDAEGRCVFVNRAWVELTGRAAASELGYGWLARVHPEDRDRVMPRFQGAMRARRPFEVEYRIRDAEGAWRWLLSVGAPRFAADGAFVGYMGSCVDLTERKETDSALRASEERFAAIVAQATTGFAEADLAGRFRLVNDRFCEIAGRPREDLLALHIQDITHPEERAALPGAFERLAREGSPFDMETRYVRPDGAVVWVSHSVSWIRDTRGVPQAMFAVCVDVTARRRAEHALRLLADAGETLAASLGYDDTLAALTDLIVPALGTWCTVFLHDRAEGAEGAEGAGPLRVAATSCAKPEKADAARRAGARACSMDGGERHPARVVAATGRSLLLTQFTPEAVAAVSTDAEYQRIIAELAPVSAVVAPLVAGGRVLGALALSSDDPARVYDADDVRLVEDLARRAGTAVENARLHGAEQRARAAAEASVERTARLQRVTAALSGAVTSEQVARVALDAGLGALGAEAGYLVLIDATGRAFSQIHAVGVPEESLANWRGALVEAHNPLAEAVRERQVVVYATAAERAARWGAPPPAGFEASIVVPLCVDDRAFGAWSVAFRVPRGFSDDERAFLLAIGQQAALALERARLYEAERVARAEAERANRAKSEFLAVMSHELRTPLNAIAGYAELLELGVHGPVTDKQREDLTRIQRSQRHLLGLINQVLSYARVETGTVRYALDDVRVADVLAAVEPLVLPQARAKALELRIAACPPSAVARADADRFQQVLVNLLSNAVKFTPRGGRVEVGCDVTPSRVAVWVRDSGIGIPADKLDAVFEPFVQVDGGLTRSHEGTGLGLAISRDLARGMGGEVAVESALGAGSTFTLTLPRGRAAARNA